MLLFIEVDLLVSTKSWYCCEWVSGNGRGLLPYWQNACWRI